MFWPRLTVAKGLHVSPVGLGTAMFGSRLSKEACFAQLDRYTEVGNLIDTARVYGDWVPGERGLSEQVIGEWLASRRTRGRVVISTKGAHPRFESMDVPRASPEDIRSDLRLSLQALGTDFVDLYFLHRDDPSLPVGAMLECLENERRAGHIRFYGCSNWKLPRIIEAREYARTHGLAGFVCNQLMWSLASLNPLNIEDPTLVGMDGATYAYHRDTGMAAIAYTSIANGYFAHLEKGDLRDDVRRRYDVPENEGIYERLKTLSAERGLSMAALSLLYFASSPFPAIPLASFSRPEQLDECLALLADKPDPGFDLQQLRPDLVGGQWRSVVMPE